MRCRLKPIEYACEPVTEPIVEDGAVVGMPGDFVIVLGSGTRLVCPAEEFAIHYEIVAGGDENADDPRGQEDDH